MITFRDICARGDVILKIVSLSKSLNTEVGAILIKDERGVRLAYDELWIGAPTHLIIPIPKAPVRGIAIVHSHIGSPLLSIQDLRNFKHSSVNWICTVTYNGRIRVRCVHLRRILPRELPLMVAYLEDKIKYTTGLPIGFRTKIRECYL